MAQKAFINFKDEILSFPLIEKNMGIFSSGRYTGFDSMASVSGLIIRLSHLALAKKTLSDGTQQLGFGSFITPTGTIIHEDSSIDLTISPNTGNLNTRIDLIIAEHVYSTIQGGVIATYNVIQGPNDGNEPALTNDKIQTILAKVSITPGGTTFAHLSLITVAPPFLGSTLPTNVYNFIKSLILPDIPLSTTTIKGLIELATNAEGLGGTDTERAITAAVLSYVLTQGNYVKDANYIHTDNNFTTTLLNKLTALNINAEQNVQTDWDEPDINSDAYLKNKPNVLAVWLQGKTTQGIDVASASAISSVGQIGFTNVAYDKLMDSFSQLTFTFPALPSNEYHVLVTMRSLGTASSDEAVVNTVKDLTTTSFKLLLREFQSEAQNVTFYITIIPTV